MFAWAESFRTYDWMKALPVPELAISQIRQLLSLVLIYTIKAQIIEFLHRLMLFCIDFDTYCIDF